MGALDIGRLESQGTSWQVAHLALSRLARQRAAADAEEGRWLLTAQRAAVHVHLGYGSFGEYIERLFGYQPRSTQEKLRVAEALEGLPELERALSSGEISWSAVRELTRVAQRETEHEWLQFARDKTLRQLEQVLAGKRPGDTPASPPDPSARRHILRFEVAAETFALFRDALNELRRRTATSDDDSALLELARHVLGGPREEGRGSYQIVLSVCPECGNGRQQTTGGLVPVGPAVIRMAHCDAQHVSLNAEQNPTPANDFTAQDSRDEGQRAPGRASPLHEDAHLSAGTAPRHDAHLSAGNASDLEAHVSACPSNHDALASASPHQHDALASASPHQHDALASVHNASAHAAPGSASNPVQRDNGSASRAFQTGHRKARKATQPRATQTIPPALRRAVLLRDERRCQVPGCTNARWVDLHHLELRCDGGPNSPENIVCVCSTHHRAAHRGEIALDRAESGALRVRHADGTPYGREVNPRVLEVRAKVFSALRDLGFREAQVRAALEQLDQEREPALVTFDGLLREALARLRPAVPRR